MTWIHAVALGYHAFACAAIVLMSMGSLWESEKRRVGRLYGAALYLICVGAFAYLVEPLLGWRPNLAIVLLESGVVLMLIELRSRTTYIAPKRGRSCQG